MREKRSVESNRVISPFRMIDHAISLQQVANHLNEGMDTKPPSTTLFQGMFIATPVLMTLAVEIAFKALLCQEGKKDCAKGHNLVELFQRLNEHTQARLKARLPITLDAIWLKLGVQDFYPVEAGIEKVLEYHQDIFIDWRYSYENANRKSCYLSELDKVFMAIVETYKETEVAEHNDSQSN